MAEIKQTEIKHLLKDDYYRHPVNEQQIIQESLESYFDEHSDKKSVLGLDVYKYSKYQSYQQDIIPFLLQEIYTIAIKEYYSGEGYASELYPDLKTQFIDTGDGGYWIFQNPLDSLIFSLYLNAAFHLFNSYIIYPTLRSLLGPLTVRFAKTYDKIFQFNQNLYGSAIIKNSRLMSRDSLNRLLLDDSSYDWFLRKISGVENIMHFEEMKTQRNVQKEKDTFLSIYDSSFFLNKYKDDSSDDVIHIDRIFENVICQKLDNISVKNEEFRVFNLFIQYWVTMTNEDEFKAEDEHFFREALTLSLGNLNTNGI